MQARRRATECLLIWEGTRKPSKTPECWLCRCLWGWRARAPSSSLRQGGGKISPFIPVIRVFARSIEVALEPEAFCKRVRCLSAVP